MMKTAKLFIDGSEYCDIEYLHDRYLGHCVDLNLQDKIDLSEYNDGDFFDVSVINEDGKELINGRCVVNIIKTVTLKVNND